MPCSDGQDYVDLRELDDKVNKLTRMLCSVCRKMENNFAPAIMDKETKEWWENHKKIKGHEP